MSGLHLENDGSRLGFRSNQLGYSTIIGPNGFPKYYQVIEVALRMPSEHMIDGKQFPAELQVIQHNQKTVLEYDDSDVIVSSIFFNVGEESKLFKQLLHEQLPGAGEFKLIRQPVDLQWALGPALNGPFYKYDEDCKEAVQWTIFESPMTMSAEQTKALRAVFPHGNARPVHPFNGRRLLKNSMAEGEAVHHRYFLNREFGRDKKVTPIHYIVFPMIGTLVLCAISMTAIFQTEKQDVKLTSAGGLESDGQTIGKGYEQL